MQFTYRLALKGAQLNDPRGQKKNESVAGGVKSFLSPEAKPTVFTMIREKTKQSRCVLFKKKPILLLISFGHYHT